jgi:hypothetical protein
LINWSGNYSHFSDSWSSTWISTERSYNLPRSYSVIFFTCFLFSFARKYLSFVGKFFFRDVSLCAFRRLIRCFQSFKRLNPFYALSIIRAFQF